MTSSTSAPARASAAASSWSYGGVNAGGSARTTRTRRRLRAWRCSSARGISSTATPSRRSGARFSARWSSSSPPTTPTSSACRRCRSGRWPPRSVERHARDRRGRGAQPLLRSAELGRLADRAPPRHPPLRGHGRGARDPRGAPLAVVEERRERVGADRGAPRRAARRTARSSANFHVTGGDRAEEQFRRVVDLAGGRRCRSSPATSTSGRRIDARRATPSRSPAASTRSSSAACRRRRRSRGRPERRRVDGRLLSDHAPVEVDGRMTSRKHARSSRCSSASRI